MKTLILTLLSLTLMSCGGQGPKSKLKVSRGFAVSAAPEGMMLYLHHKDSNLMRSLKVDNNEVTLELDHGDWDVKAYGWDNTYDVSLAISMKCARKSISLSEDQQNLDLELKPESCETEDTFVKLVNCNQSVNVGNIVAGANCDSNKGATQSYKVKLIEYDPRKASEFSGLTPDKNGLSRCIVSSGSSVTDASLRLPLGGPDSGIATFVTAYTNNNCSETGMKKVFFFAHGMRGFSSPDFALKKYQDDFYAYFRHGGLPPLFGTVSAGDRFTCSVQGGGAKCWGYNTYGQLGNGSNISNYTPQQVSGLSSGVMAVQTGNGFACALLTNGSVKCWGEGGNGQLGDGNSTASNVPVSVSGLNSGVTHLSVGMAHACAVQAGAAKCWGDNTDGQLGNNSNSNSSTPVAVSNMGSQVTKIAAGMAGFSCAIKNGGAWCWGADGSGQLGNDNSNVGSNVPVQVSGLTSNVSHISAGEDTACAIQAGAAKCWGYNYSGQLGNDSATSSSVPVQVYGLNSGVTNISAGKTVYSHTCAVVNGAAYCWGENVNGQLGDNTTTDSDIPVAVSSLGSGVIEISSGDNHSCATLAVGGQLCWGNGSNGELGQGSNSGSNIPVSVVY